MLFATEIPTRLDSKYRHEVLASDSMGFKRFIAWVFTTKLRVASPRHQPERFDF